MKTRQGVVLLENGIGFIGNLRLRHYIAEIQLSIAFIALDCCRLLARLMVHKYLWISHLKGPELTGLEPAASAVTGRRSNQLSYNSISEEQRN